MPVDSINVSTDEIAQIAAQLPANPIALALAVESQGVGVHDFRLPTRQLAQLNFLPGWTRQNYRTAIATAIGLGLIVRMGPPLPGRAGTRYRMRVRNGLESGPLTDEAE